jgi:hypothetical protein
MAPLVLLQIGDWTAIGRAFPGFRIDSANATEIAQHLYSFMLGDPRAVPAQRPARAQR